MDVTAENLESLATPNDEDNYRATLEAEAPTDGLRKMLFGMGSLSLGELAGARMKVSSCRPFLPGR